MTSRNRTHRTRGDAESAAAAAGAPTDRRPPDNALVQVHDLAGRPRGTGFAADHHGTVITSHEAVDGLPRLVLHAGDRRRTVDAGAVVPLPALGLALVRTEGLGVAPLPVAARDRIEAGDYVRIAAGCWREARVLGTADVTYTATDRRHRIADALELAVGTAGRDALRLGGGAAGGPVLDAGTGAVLGVLGTALATGDRDVGFAVPLRAPAGGPLADLLAENAATVPAYGADLNPAGILELTATSIGQDGPPGASAGGLGLGLGPEPVERIALLREFAAFDAGPASVLGLVGPPGSGRTTELAALAVRRARRTRPAPTLWLRGADLRDDDASVADAAARALARAARIVAAASGPPGPAGPGDITPDRLARVARDTGRPLLLLLDGPEEMPPLLAHRLAEWTRGTATWLRDTGTRLVVACRPEYWERAGTGFPGELLHAGGVGERAAAQGGPGGGSSRGGVPGGGPSEGGASGDGSLRAGGGSSPDGVHGGGRPGGGASGGVGSSGDGAPGGGRGSLPDGVHGAGSSGGGAPGGGCGSLPDGVHGGGSSGGGAPGGGCGSSPNGVHGGACSRSGAPGVGSSGDRVPGDGSHRDDAPGAGSSSHGAPGPGPSADGVCGCGPSTGTADGRVSCGQAVARPAAPSESRPGAGSLPPCVRIGDLDEDEARRARERYRIPEGLLAGADARHPLTLRLLSEVRAAFAAPAPLARVDRDAVLAAYLDLMCLRVAVRLATQNGLRGTAVRRLAARVSGQVHEAARRSLGPGQGELDRETFEALFPWGQAPARLGGGTGWASAVLAEGLLVPAGPGYRFAHEELADWIQGTHLDLDAALRALVHRRRTHPAHPLPVPHHRIGPVVEALLLLARQHGTEQLALRLEELVLTLDDEPYSWWAARLVAEVLTRVPDATPYASVLRLLADALVARREEGCPVPGEFGAGFWADLALPQATRLALLRRLVLADGPPDEPGPRHLDTVAALLAAAPRTVQPLLVSWFDDERPLPAAPHATVATAAQALLHTHRHRAPDDLTEALADSTHRRADELLTALAEDEPAAVCRAVDRWAHDPRPARHAAAMTYGLRAAEHVRTDADRSLLRHAAHALLARPADSTLHGAALALLVRDPVSRDQHLGRALGHFAAGDPYFPPSAAATALPAHPGPVLDAFRARLRGPDAGEALRRLADATPPGLARRVAALIADAVAERPETAGHVAAYTDRRLTAHGPAARSVLLPLVTGLLTDGPEPVRAALAGVLAAPGTAPCAALRRELREFLLAHEQDPAVLDALLHAAPRCTGDDLRGLVHRLGVLLVRTPSGAVRFDRGLVDLSRHTPGFAVRVTGWLTDAPQEWAALVGPSARRTIENLAGVRVPA
ncbi:hypothetical protein ACLGIH_08860 [Streptomyces sp. HMX87]|uniref:hypothetical protein n=1 Tax=Streptomyces sp. HMX87 TaxID=3390849 RepID=UPI003A8ADC6E